MLTAYAQTGAMRESVRPHVGGEPSPRPIAAHHQLEGGWTDAVFRPVSAQPVHAPRASGDKRSEAAQKEGASVQLRVNVALLQWPPWSAWSWSVAAAVGGDTLLVSTGAGST